MGKKKYISVEKAAGLWSVSERSVRNYCAQGRVIGALQEGGVWKIPFDAKKPTRKIRNVKTKSTILEILKREKEAGVKGGLYHKIQIDLTYNSNHIEGSKLSHDQTRYIFETKTIGMIGPAIKVDDILETINHFRCVDLVIEGAGTKLSESFIKQLHYILKTGTTDSQKSWFRVGDYKMLENEVGGSETAKPDQVGPQMKALLAEYNSKSKISFDDILDFHVRFEKIHPFQDGNGRIGRLIMFKECLKHKILPFIITEEVKFFYYRGIKEWKNERGYLRDTCLCAQDEMKEILKGLGIN